MNIDDLNELHKKGMMAFADAAFVEWPNIIERFRELEKENAEAALEITRQNSTITMFTDNNLTTWERVTTAYAKTIMKENDGLRKELDELRAELAEATKTRDLWQDNHEDVTISYEEALNELSAIKKDLIENQNRRDQVYLPDGLQPVLQYIRKWARGGNEPRDHAAVPVSLFPNLIEQESFGRLVNVRLNSISLGLAALADALEQANMVTEEAFAILAGEFGYKELTDVSSSSTSPAVA